MDPGWLTLCTFLQLLVAGCSSATSPTFFVAMGGSDDNPGTEGSPFATLQRAQQAIRAVHTPWTANAVVYLRSGSYFLTRPVNFSTADSGQSGFTVEYTTFPADVKGGKGHALLHGGIDVVNWKRVNASSNVWVAPFPSDLRDTRQAYIQSSPGAPFRRLNFTEVPVSDLFNGNGSLVKSVDGFITKQSVGSWASVPEQSVSDVELLFTGSGSTWTECHVRIASISFNETSGLTSILMAQPGWSMAANRPYGQGVHLPVSAMNVFAALSPGKGYISKAQRAIYYAALPGEDLSAHGTARVVAAATEQLVVLQGVRDVQAGMLQPVHHVTFSNIDFAFATWLLPNSGQGWVDQQSGFQNLGPQGDSGSDDVWIAPPGNVALRAVSDVAIVNCSFSHMGSTALTVLNSSRHVRIDNNTFHDTSCGGIYVGQIDDVNISASFENTDINITNNVLFHVPVEYRDCAALLGGYVTHSTISHNYVESSPNTAVSLGWGWARDQATNSGYNNITFNWINGSNWLLEDGGSLYVLGPQPSSNMAFNYVSFQVKLWGCLYTDEGSAYWSLFSNVVNGGEEWLHIWNPNIHNEYVFNNWHNQKFQTMHGTNITIYNNHLLPTPTVWPAGALKIIATAGPSWMSGPKPT